MLRKVIILLLMTCAIKLTGFRFHTVLDSTEIRPVLIGTYACFANGLDISIMIQVSVGYVEFG